MAARKTLERHSKDKGDIRWSRAVSSSGTSRSLAGQSEPTLIHHLQEIGCDRKPGRRANHCVNSAPRTGCRRRLSILDPLNDLRRLVDRHAIETAAKHAGFHLSTVCKGIGSYFLDQQGEAQRLNHFLRKTHQPSPPPCNHSSMNSTPRALLAAALCLSAAGLPAIAQTNVPWSPMPNPDPRIAQAMAKMRTTQGHRLWRRRHLARRHPHRLHPLRQGRHVFGLLPYPATAAAQEKLITIPGTKDCSSSDPVWSPDSQTLAFTSDCVAAPAGASATAKKEKTVADLPLRPRHRRDPPAHPHRRPLRQRRLLAQRQRARLPLRPERHPLRRRTRRHETLVRRHRRRRRRNPARLLRQHQDRRRRLRHPRNLHVFEFAWSPASHEITYIAANPPGENNWWVAKLYPQQKVPPPPRSSSTPPPPHHCAARPADRRAPLLARRQTHRLHRRPHVRPGLHRRRRLGRAQPTGGDPTDITPGHRRHPHLGGSLARITHRRLRRRPPRPHAADRCTTSTSAWKSPGSADDLGEVSVGGGPIKDAISASKPHGVLAFVRSGHTPGPRDLRRGGRTPSSPSPTLNDGAKSRRTAPNPIEWTNEGFHVQGWLTYPVRTTTPSQEVSAHRAGPRRPVRLGRRALRRLGLGRSWATSSFQPNPRGSFGQGEKFTAANIKDFGYGDLRDILAGMDAVEKKVSIDKNREGLMGWSYGGFMTMFGVTQTHRFKAAIAGAGISDWKSYYGENSIDQWMVPFFGATVYDDPKVYAKSSAIDFIKKVKTPTLVVVGDRDGECPAPQSFEFWHALRAEGVKNPARRLPQRRPRVPRSRRTRRTFMRATWLGLRSTCRRSNPGCSRAGVRHGSRLQARRRCLTLPAVSTRPTSLSRPLLICSSLG